VQERKAAALAVSQVVLLRTAAVWVAQPAVRAALLAKQAADNPANPVVVPAVHQVALARRSLRSVCLRRVLVALQRLVCRTQAPGNLVPVVVPLALMAAHLALHHHLHLLRHFLPPKVAVTRRAKAFSLDRAAERRVRARVEAVQPAPAVAKQVAAQAAA
jgi:hypothetical protein